MIGIKKEEIIEILSILTAILILASAVITVKLIDRYERSETETTTVAEQTTTTQSTTESTTSRSIVISATTTTEPSTTESIQSETVLINTIQGIDEKTINRIAGICYGEAVGSPREEIAKVAWCICNRSDAWGLPLYDVAAAPNQFYYVDNMAYRDIAIDVLSRWQAEKNGEEVYRELGPEYLWFTGDGQRNYFRTSY